MAIPKIMKNFHLLVDGHGYAGICDEVKLPDLKMKVDEHRAGGMDAPVPLEIGMEKLELGFTMAEHHPFIFRQYGLLNQNAVQCNFRGAVADDVSVENYWIEVRGMYTELKLGTAKLGDKGKLEAVIGLRYFRLVRAGQELLLFDIDNFVRIVNGVDQLEAMRAAMLL